MIFMIYLRTSLAAAKRYAIRYQNPDTITIAFRCPIRYSINAFSMAGRGNFLSRGCVPCAGGSKIRVFRFIEVEFVTTWNAVSDTSEVYLDFEGTPFGRCKLWMPEGIATPRGLAGVYPRGMRWREDGGILRQAATAEHVFGPGNITEIEPGVLACGGIRYVKELPLPWTSWFRFEAARVDFSLSIHNPHSVSIPEVAALICLKFMEAAWWSPSSCFMATDDGIKTIAQMPWIDGKHPSFQKWHIGPGTPYDNVVLNAIWTSNPVRAISPQWVVRHEQSGCSLVFSGESAYYIHCNRGNPCNDVALKFGDMAPGQTYQRSGRIEIRRDAPEALFRKRDEAGAMPV